MFSFHKPKIYRSNNGCCICRAKSSSSRFTDSCKYEQEFEKCFRIREKRQGEICNACVLLVKRWKKLPDGTNRHWNHVVDARAGPGTKSTLKMKNKLSPTMQKYKSPLKAKHRSSAQSLQPSFSSIPSPLPEELSGYEDSLDKSDVYSGGLTDSEDSDSDTQMSGLSHLSEPAHQGPISRKPHAQHQISPFLDLTYWTMTEVCCGFIFKGMNGEILVDPTLLKPCWSCGKNKSRSQNDTGTSTNNNNNNQTSAGSQRILERELTRSTSLDDMDSNSSTPAYNMSDFYEPNTPEPETPPDSPPDSPKMTLTPTEEMTQLQQCATKMNFVTSHSITMEC